MKVPLRIRVSKLAITNPKCQDPPAPRPAAANEHMGNVLPITIGLLPFLLYPCGQSGNR
jgi:hypothetical protein